MLFLGIDQHKRQLTVNLRCEDGSVVLKRQVSTRWERVRAFFADLAEKGRREGGFLAILEVCGMNPWLLEMLKEYGCREIVVIQPTERSRQKTDRRDAAELSHLLWVHRQQFLGGRHPLGLRRIQPPTPQEADDRQLTALRARLTKKRTAVLNGIHKILRKHNLEQACPTKGFQTQKVRRWLAEMELPGLDRLEMNLLVPQWDLLDEQLELAVIKVLRFDGAMRTWFKRIKKRRGSKIARVAVMRRLATILWHMLKKQQKYRYESPIKKHQEFVEFEGAAA